MTFLFPFTLCSTICLHAGALGAEAVHLMAICELDDSFTPADSPMTQQVSSQRSRAYFGFAFLDAAAGRFFVGTASDDAARANLGAIITQVSTTACTNCSEDKQASAVHAL